jgi:acyl-CoA dehydrogenase
MPSDPPPLPFSDPPHLSSLPSPIFSPSHTRFRTAIRAFISATLHSPLEWDAAGHVPDEVFREFAEANMLFPALPAPLPVEWLHRLGVRELLGGVKVEEFDGLHSMVYWDEVSG